VTIATAPEGVTLRRARVDDAPAFVAMFSEPEVYGGTLQLPWPSEKFWRERLAAPEGSNVPDIHLVAVHEGRLIGSAGLHPVAASMRRRHAMTLGITVVGEWQGRGVGTMLMAALCDQADNWLGLLRIELTVFTDNAAAIALYRRFGFETEGTHPAYALRDGVYVGVHSMARFHPAPPQLGLA
jgi:putative acetyltransferase